MDPFVLNLNKLRAIKPALTFSPEKDYEEQKTAIAAKFKELVKMPEPLKECVPIIEYTTSEDPRFDEIRFAIESEPGFFVPAHLLYPKNITGRIPLVICLQGHSTGMHVSLARERYPSAEPIAVSGDRDFCIQAVARGYAALTMEQRGFGELNFTGNKNACHELSWQAILMGKTLLGDRLYDISNMISAVIGAFDFIDPARIGCMGNSGGGTSSYYSACLDERIKVSMPASSFCGMVDSWGAIHHCSCSYIPDFVNWFDMADLAVMIAPRYLIAVNGRLDHLQPYETAEREFKRVKAIFEKAGAGENCTLVTGPEGHRFYANLSWDIFDKYINA